MRKKDTEELEYSIINAYRDNLGYTLVLKNNETGAKYHKSVKREIYLGVKEVLGKE